MNCTFGDINDIYTNISTEIIDNLCYYTVMYNT